MVEAMENVEEGIKVGSKWLKDVKFADDQAMVASSELGLQTIMDGLVRVAKQYDMKINVKKKKSYENIKDWRGRRHTICGRSDTRASSKIQIFRYIFEANGRCEERSRRE